MEISFLIVTRNRPNDLVVTLNKLKNLIDVQRHEVLVFIDACSKTEQIIADFNWVNWTVSKTNVSASPARHQLYKKAKGTIFIGLDDDAHPLSSHFIETVENTFNADKQIGVVAFQEVRGLFPSDEDALKKAKNLDYYETNDFIGCGFAIKKSAYKATNGFPLWIDIYGEEPAVALEIMDLGFKIVYQPSLIINHRIDVEKRKKQGRNYFRFEKQLKNTLRFYLVYYPNPMLKVAKTLVHNFKKYALKDVQYFKAFVKTLFATFFSLGTILKHRKPVKKATIVKKVTLKSINYAG